MSHCFIPEYTVIRRSSLNRAFTLIELLVVISIIVLLVAILLPALRSARTTAQMTVSMTNIRQVGMSMFAYAADNKQSMIWLRDKYWNGVVDEWQDYRFGVQWSRKLADMGYVSDIKVYWSPARTTFAGEYPHTEATGSFLGHTFENVGYGMSPAIYGSSQYEIEFTNGDTPLRLGQNAPPPSNMILLAETWGKANGGGFGESNGCLFVTPTQYDKPNAQSSPRLYNYNGNIVRSFVDGSALAVAFTTGQIIGGPTPTAIKKPDRTLLGWDTSRLPPNGVIYEGPYAGFWSFNGTGNYQTVMPWYTKWRTDGWK